MVKMGHHSIGAVDYSGAAHWPRPWDHQPEDCNKLGRLATDFHIYRSHPMAEYHYLPRQDLLDCLEQPGWNRNKTRRVAHLPHRCSLQPEISILGLHCS